VPAQNQTTPPLIADAKLLPKDGHFEPLVGSLNLRRQAMFVRADVDRPRLTERSYFWLVRLRQIGSQRIATFGNPRLGVCLEEPINGQLAIVRAEVPNGRLQAFLGTLPRSREKLQLP